MKGKVQKFPIVLDAEFVGGLYDAVFGPGNMIKHDVVVHYDIPVWFDSAHGVSQISFYGSVVVRCVYVYPVKIMIRVERKHVPRIPLSDENTAIINLLLKPVSYKGYIFAPCEAL